MKSYRENISLSDITNQADKERIIVACQKSGVDQIINKLNNGLDSFLTRNFELVLHFRLYRNGKMKIFIPT